MVESLRPTSNDRVRESRRGVLHEHACTLHFRWSKNWRLRTKHKAVTMVHNVSKLCCSVAGDIHGTKMGWFNYSRMSLIVGPSWVWQSPVWPAGFCMRSHRRTRVCSNVPSASAAPSASGSRPCAILVLPLLAFPRHYRVQKKLRKDSSNLPSIMPSTWIKLLFKLRIFAKPKAAPVVITDDDEEKNSCRTAIVHNSTCPQCPVKTD